LDAYEQSDSFVTFIPVNPAYTVTMTGVDGGYSYVVNSSVHCTAAQQATTISNFLCHLTVNYTNGVPDEVGLWILLNLNLNS
jgi:hypothetical protein